MVLLWNLGHTRISYVHQADVKMAKLPMPLGPKDVLPHPLGSCFMRQGLT